MQKSKQIEVKIGDATRIGNRFYFPTDQDFSDRIVRAIAVKTVGRELIQGAIASPTNELNRLRMTLVGSKQDGQKDNLFERVPVLLFSVGLPLRGQMFPLFKKLDLGSCFIEIAQADAALSNRSVFFEFFF